MRHQASLRVEAQAKVPAGTTDLDEIASGRGRLVASGRDATLARIA
jgi:hypothetical protein